jgi:hypothetical protein
MNSNVRRKLAWGVAGLIAGGIYWLLILLLFELCF